MNTYNVCVDSGILEFLQILLIRSHRIIGNIDDLFAHLFELGDCFASTIQDAFELPDSA